MSGRGSVLIMRPGPAAQRTAALVAALGFTPFVLPPSTVQPLPAVFPDKSFEAVIASSANAFLKPLPPQARALTALPFYCVGQRTAQAARRHGFTAIAAVAQNADALCTAIEAGNVRHFLYLAGRQRRPVLEDNVRGMGKMVDVVEVYETVYLTPAAAIQARLPQNIDFVLLYSAGNMAILGSLAGVITPRTRIVCLSPRIAAALPQTLCGQARAAAEPTEKAILSLLLSLRRARR